MVVKGKIYEVLNVKKQTLLLVDQEFAIVSEKTEDRVKREKVCL